MKPAHGDQVQPYTEVSCWIARWVLTVTKEQPLGLMRNRLLTLKANGGPKTAMVRTAEPSLFLQHFFQNGSTRFGLRRQVPRLAERETKHKAFVEQSAALG